MKKISFQEANQRFIIQGRTDIQLCEDGYVLWNKKSKFFDLIANDYFWAIPDNVYKRKSVHPTRKKDKTQKTCIEKYGVKCTLQDKNIKNRIKLTNFKKYGVENVAQVQTVKDKIKQTCLKLYGTEYVFQSKYFKNKSKKTIIERYGVEHASKTNKVKEKRKKTCFEKYNTNHVLHVQEFKNKLKQTCLEKYGVDNPLKSNLIKDKIKLTNVQRYGFEHALQSSAIRNKMIQTYKTRTNKTKFNQKYSILETKESIPEYLNTINLIKKPVLSTCITWAKLNFPNNKQISKTDFEKYLENYKENKTQLEIFSEHLFSCKHYNKKPDSINKNYRPDFKLSDTIYVNVDGLYWHSELEKNKNYHFEMRKHFEDNNLKLFQFYENEIKNKPEIVKNIINNILNQVKNKIYARQCEIKIIDNEIASKFLNENHLAGPTTAKHIGLYYNDSLVFLLSYKEKKNFCKIERICSLVNYSVIGGFSKLLNHLEINLLKPTTNKIYNWIDLRYGTGNYLLKNDFEITKEILGWKWSNGKETYNRLYYKTNMNERNLSAKQHFEKFGLFRIYDAGQRLYVKKLKNKNF